MAEAARRLFENDTEPVMTEQDPPITAGKPLSGRDLLAALESAGIIGMWADRNDIGDSSDYARTLRRQAEQR